jgi:hypothetical protein
MGNTLFDLSVGGIFKTESLGRIVNIKCRVSEICALILQNILFKRLIGTFILTLYGLICWLLGSCAWYS